MKKEVVDKWALATGKVYCSDLGKTGSGFFLGDQGLFITNNHVVSAMSLDATGAITVSYSSEVLVKASDGIYRATLEIDQNSDRPVVYDYAILRVDMDPPACFDTADASSVFQGEDVMAIGYPFQFDDPIVTTGVVSAVVSRPSHVNTLHRLRTFLTDSLITYGSSGGPLVRVSDGCVIGVATMPYELRDEARKRLRRYLSLPGMEVMLPIRDLIELVLKYVSVGFNYAISIEYAMDDSVYKSNGKGD